MRALEDATIAVIGSNSFSGAHFVAQALEIPGTRVVGLSRSPEYPDCMLAYAGLRSDRLRCERVDLVRDLGKLMAILDDERPSFVVNFAAQGEVASSFSHPLDHWQTNALGIVALVEALRTRSWLQRFMQISTPEVYGAMPVPATEDHPLSPTSPYAASKGAADLHIEAITKSQGFPAITIRATNVYGPCQQLYRIIPRTFIRIRTGEKVRLDGGGRAIKSYVHISDITRGELLALAGGRLGAVYHFGPHGEGMTIRSVVESVARAAGMDPMDVMQDGPDRPGQDAVYRLDWTRAREELDWEPRIGFDTGITGVGTWIEQSWDDIARLPQEYIHQR